MSLLQILHFANSAEGRIVGSSHVYNNIYQQWTWDEFEEEDDLTGCPPNWLKSSLVGVAEA
jgi:hypothetical protein